MNPIRACNIKTNLEYYLYIQRVLKIENIQNLQQNTKENFQ